MMRTKSNVNAFVFGEEARRDFGEEKEKNEEGGGRINLRVSTELSGLR